MFYTYVLRCSDDSLYTGMTNDIKNRINKHYYKKQGCAKYTRSHQVVEVKRVWQCESKTDATKLEFHFKNLSKTEKLYLIDNPTELSTYLGDKITAENYSVLDITLSALLDGEENEET